LFCTFLGIRRKRGHHCSKQRVEQDGAQLSGESSRTSISGPPGGKRVLVEEDQVVVGAHPTEPGVAPEMSAVI